MARLSFHPHLNGLMFVAALLAATVLVAIFYRRAFAVLRSGQWCGLYLLRVAAILIVLLLLFHPVLYFDRHIADRRLLVVLLDTSASMGIADGQVVGSRLDRARAWLHDRAVRWRDQFDLRLIAFDGSSRRVKSLDQLARLEATGKATSLTSALAAARRTAPAREIEAALLVTDGIDNAAGDPVQFARRLGFPVDTIGTGNTLRDRRSLRDIRVTGVECPDPLFVHTKARLKGFVDATGFPRRVAQVVLRDGDRPLEKRQLVLDDADGPQGVLFEFIPEAKGLHTYTVAVVPAAEETIAENNQRSASTLVVDSRIRVLYVEGTLRAEYGALVGHFLARDPALEFCALVQTRPKVFAQRSNIEGLQLKGIPDRPDLLATFHVFLIGDLDQSYFKPAALARICQRVRDGAGLLLMGGYHSLGPGGYAETPLAAVLPVFLGDRQIGQVTKPFLPALTADGRQHPIFANIAQFFPGVKQPAMVAGLPPLRGCVRVEGAKPGATVLAVALQEVASGRPMPVMAVQPVGAGRAAIFTGDTTYLWHQIPRTMNRESPFLRFWGQTVRYLAGHSDQMASGPGIVATTDKSHYPPETPIAIAAVVRGAEGEAEGNARVTATVEGPRTNDTALVLQPIPGPAGHYRVTFAPRQSGRYEIAVMAQLGATRLDADPLAVEVGHPDLEFDRLDLDRKTLMAIAQATGGHYTHLTTADRLVDRIERRRRERQLQYELPLSSPPPMWLLLVGVLTTEWLLRRRYQLR